MTEFLGKNKKEIAIIIGTIIVSFFILLKPEITNLLFPFPKNSFGGRPMSWVFFLFFFPGLFSSLLSAISWKNVNKALIVGVITTIFWYISWFTIAVISYHVY